jgi:Leucine-rich repeat (LRR) protein
MTTSWRDIPIDVKRKVFSWVPLTDMLQNVQVAMGSDDTRADICARIDALRPLYEAWINSPMEVRNLPAFRTANSRRRTRPAQFTRCERLVIGHSNLSGMLSSAIGELYETLKVLHCDSNGLCDLPRELARCQELRVLDASDNDFRQVPPCCSEMKRLRLLSFSQNENLGPRIPALADTLPLLTHLGFYGCALTELPEALIKRIVRSDEPFFANVSYNSFPHGYLEDLYRLHPTLRSRVGIL